MITQDLITSYSSPGNYRSLARVGRLLLPSQTAELKGQQTGRQDEYCGRKF